MRGGAAATAARARRQAPGYQKLRGNPLLFSLIRATEPYLDEYAEHQIDGGLVRDVLAAGFADVRLAAATGRHFALVAVKGRAAGEGGGAPRAAVVVDDRRFDADGRYGKDDTHLKTWEREAAASAAVAE